MRRQGDNRPVQARHLLGFTVGYGAALGVVTGSVIGCVAPPVDATIALIGHLPVIFLFSLCGVTAGATAGLVVGVSLAVIASVRGRSVAAPGWSPNAVHERRCTAHRLVARIMLISEIATVVSGAGVGLVVGLDYPPTAAFAAIECAILSTLPGLAIGVLAAAIVMVARLAYAPLARSRQG